MISCKKCGATDLAWTFSRDPNAKHGKLWILCHAPPGEPSPKEKVEFDEKLHRRHVCAIEETVQTAREDRSAEVLAVLGQVLAELRALRLAVTGDQGAPRRTA